MARGRRGRPARQLPERDRDRILDVVGEAAEPGAEDDADARDEAGPAPDRRLERVEASGLVCRRDRRSRGASDGSARGPPKRVQGEDGRGPLA